jgi:hypothetical protein
MQEVTNMANRLKFMIVLVSLGCLLGAAHVPSVHADELLLDRGLPIWNGNTGTTSNLNGYNPSAPPPASRSNNAPYPPPGSAYSTQPTIYPVSGDDFTLGSAGQTYHIDTVRLWIIYGVAASQYDTSNSTAPTFNMTLWAGDTSGVQPVVNTYSATRVWYSDGENFQRAVGGAWRQIWQIDFTATDNNRIPGGQPQRFFLDGMFQNADQTWQAPSLHVEDALLSNNPADGADGHYLWLTLNNGSPGDIISTTGSPLGFGLPAKPFDANIQIYGSQVPLPSTMMLLGSGLLSLAGWRMRKR